MDNDPDRFHDWPSLLRTHAQQRPDAAAVVAGGRQLSWAQFDARIDAVAATLQAQGQGPGDTVALCAANGVDAVVVFAGALRAGLAIVPLAGSSTPAQLQSMVADAGARLVFANAAFPDCGVPVVALDDSGAALGRWLTHDTPAPVAIQPDWPFNIIYSSGTTGTPKGIVQPHAMRWAHIMRAALSGYAADTVTLLATPIYSNTTLVCLIPTLAYGGCAVLMPKFDALAYLQLAQQHRATHTMLVPVQYRRLMDCADFGRFDMSSFRWKFCTSAPFHAELKQQVLQRWPGALVEYYGLTEGGGTCILHAHLHPTKLHTVGQPAPGHDIRLIDEEGREIDHRSGASGEVVGRSPGMMSGYHRQPELSAAAEWFDADGRRFLRTGDVGRFDEDGFLILHDRRKDMIISGGFNIYPSDLEAVLRTHADVADAAVVGVPSRKWGETPVAYCVLRDGAAVTADMLREWMNAQVGKTQRLHALRLLPELPRSAIGKVLKRELRERWVADQARAGPPEAA